MLVSAAKMLKDAKAGKYAVGHFNINNLEWTKAILLTAQELNSPVILGVSEGAGKYMCGFKTVTAMVDAMVDELGITVPVALHLDHGSYEGALKCIEAGFSSVMFDGSHYGIEENIEKTKEIIALAHSKGISVEAEVGAIGGEEDGVFVQITERRFFSAAGQQADRAVLQKIQARFVAVLFLFRPAHGEAGACPRGGECDVRERADGAEIVNGDGFETHINSFRARRDPARQ